VITFRPVSSCRLSGESLGNAHVLLELPDCPFPGVYPENSSESLRLRTPLKIVQASCSGFVQTAHAFDADLYAKYCFSGSTGAYYRKHVEKFARQIAARLQTSARILEIGCGDGYLIRELRSLGFQSVTGIDPSYSTKEKPVEGADIYAGYFPRDLPYGRGEQAYDLIVCRHVLEHIEDPRTFVHQIRHVLAPQGEVWVEVPDLESTIRKNMWSNLYQLHCNYFTSATLDLLLGDYDFRCIQSEVVDVFGGSLFHRYSRGAAALNSASADSSKLRSSFAVGLKTYMQTLASFAKRLPYGTVGYGAAERTAVTLGHEPELISKIGVLCDANALIHGRYLAGTNLEIKDPSSLKSSPPSAVVLFAVSHYEEIVQHLKGFMPGDTMIGLLRDECQLRALSTL
jgi:SAM-dependent methyltransferase